MHKRKRNVTLSLSGKRQKPWTQEFSGNNSTFASTRNRRQFHENRRTEPSLRLCGNFKKENLIEIIQLLIQHGIDVNCKTKDELNALTLLRNYYRHFNLNEIIELLIQHGMDRGRQF